MVAAPVTLLDHPSQEGLTSEQLGSFLSLASCTGVRQCGASVLMWQAADA